MSNFEVGVRLTADGRGLVSETNAAKQALGGLSGEQRKASSDSAAYTSQIERQNTSLAGLKTGLIAAAGAYVSFNAAIAGGKAVIDAALAQERLNNTLKVGLGSQQAATQEIKFLREESDKLGLQFSTTAQQYAKLTAASKGTELQGQATRDIFLSIAKASTVMGLSADQTGGALLAIEQIISKGTVSAEELRGQLGERLPGAFQIAARAMDVTTQELGEMLQRGEVLAEDLLPKLAAELERTYGAEAQNAAQGLNAQINRLDNSFTDLKLAVADAGVVAMFSDAVVGATEFIGVTTQVIQQLRTIAEEASKIPGIGQVASNVTPGNIIKAVTGNNILGNIYSSGILGQLFGSDVRAEVTATTQELEKAEEVISRIVRPGAKPELPKEFAQALKQEAAERKKLADKIVREAERAAKAEEREAQRRVDSAQSVINALIRETEEIGKNAVQKRLMAAAAEAATAPTKELAAEIMASAQAWAQATQAQEESLALQKEQQEAADRRAKAEIEAARQVQQEWNQMWSTVENTARTSFIQFAAHGKDAIESIGRSIQNGIIDVLYQLTVRPWIINVGTNLLGNGGSGGALNAASAGLSVANLFKTGLGATSLVGSGLTNIAGNGLLGSFGAGLSGGSGAAAFLGAESAVAGAGTAASLGAGVAAAAGPAIALLAVDQIGKFLANGRTTGTFVDKIPVIGGLAGALFGRKPFKADRQDLVGTITAAGFDGVFNDSYKAQGSLFKGSRRDNIIVDTDTGALLNQYGRLSESGISGQLSQYIDPAIERARQLGSVLDESITITAESLRSVAKTLDISTESLDNFSLSVDLVSEKGKQLDDAQIAQVIADAAEQMATGLIPEIDNFSKRGESAVQTIARLGAQFDVLTNAASVVLGKSGADARSLVKSFGLADQSAFVEAAGGIQTLSQGIEQFFNNLDDSDKLPILEDRLRGILKTVGVDFIPTMDQFNAAMQSGKLSAEQYVTALNPVTQTLIKQVDDLRESFKETSDEAEKAAAAVRIRRVLANERTSFTSGRRDAQQNVIDLAEERKRRSIEADIAAADERAAKEKELLKLRFDNERLVLEENRKRSQEITGFVSSLRRSAASVSPFGFAESGNILQAAISRVANGEDFQNIITDRVQSAVNASGNIDERLFGSYADFARARGAAASQINELASLGENQLTTEGQTLEELQRQTVLLEKTFDVLSRRIDFGAEFDKSRAGQSVSGAFLTPGGTAKRTAVQSAQRQIYILENDLEQDPRALLQARLQLIRASATPETVYGGGKLTQDISDMIEQLQKFTIEQFRTNQMLKRLSPEGDALRTRNIS